MEELEPNASTFIAAPSSNEQADKAEDEVLVDTAMVMVLDTSASNEQTEEDAVASDIPSSVVVDTPASNDGGNDGESEVIVADDASEKMSLKEALETLKTLEMTETSRTFVEDILRKMQVCPHPVFDEKDKVWICFKCYFEVTIMSWHEHTFIRECNGC